MNEFEHGSRFRELVGTGTGTRFSPLKGEPVPEPPQNDFGNCFEWRDEFIPNRRILCEGMVPTNEAERLVPGIPLFRFEIEKSTQSHAQIISAKEVLANERIAESSTKGFSNRLKFNYFKDLRGPRENMVREAFRIGGAA